MRKPYIAGNWKMNMTPSAGAAFASDLARAAKEAGCDVKMMIAPPFVTIPAVLEAVRGTGIIVAAQNMNDHKSGAYTGEVSPEMLKDLGVNTVILGHSERRSYYGESDEFINRKVLLAIEEGMDVVLCVGETLEETGPSVTLSSLAAGTYSLQYKSASYESDAFVFTVLEAKIAVTTDKNSYFPEETAAFAAELSGIREGETILWYADGKRQEGAGDAGSGDGSGNPGHYDAGDFRSAYL